MMRAVFHDGQIEPLEPVPREWANGQELCVEPVGSPNETAGDSDGWLEEMRMLTAELNDPSEWQQIETKLAEADRQAKELVRREMGLD